VDLSFLKQTVNYINPKGVDIELAPLKKSIGENMPIIMNEAGRSKERARKQKAYMEKLEGRVVGLEKALVMAFDKVEEYIKLTDKRIDNLEKNKASKPRKLTGKDKKEQVEPILTNGIMETDGPELPPLVEDENKSIEKEAE